jgi:hypothetical protein
MEGKRTANLFPSRTPEKKYPSRMILGATYGRGHGDPFCTYLCVAQMKILLGSKK